MEVFHIIGKEMENISPDGDSYTFLDGDVYVVDNKDEIWIWIGKDCAVEEQTVGAWVANKLDNQERGGEPSVYSTKQNDEPEDFTNLIEFNVVDGDTPGFLKRAELDVVKFKLYRVYIKKETASIDDAQIEEVKLDKKSLSSKDVFVLDGNDELYMWIGKEAQREEKFEGQKLMQKIDSDRNYLPLSYTIYEGEGGKSEEGFYKLIKKLAEQGSAISVEDQRELGYRPEDQKQPEQRSKTKEEKKGFFARLLSIFR